MITVSPIHNGLPKGIHCTTFPQLLKHDEPVDSFVSGVSRTMTQYLLTTKATTVGPGYDHFLDELGGRNTSGGRYTK